MHRLMSSTLASKTFGPIAHVHGLLADLVVGVLLPLCDDHGLEIFALVHLRLDFLDEVGQIRGILVVC